MDPGDQLALVLWALTALSLVLVVLRLYTRVYIVKFVGVEDHVFACTAIFLIVFTGAIQVSVRYGLGQHFLSLSLESSSRAIFWTYVANTFAVIGNALAKISMGLFLLRVVQVVWHKVAIIGLLIVTAGTSVTLTVMLWNQTTPVNASWDPLRVPGKWNFDIQPLSVGLGVWSSACDFFFAIFPWLCLWTIRMPQREKIMLALSMSLGVIAGICGIVRTAVLARLDVSDYTLNFVSYFAWAGAEIAVALICLSLPLLRALCLRRREFTLIEDKEVQSCNSSTPQFIMIEKGTCPTDALPKSHLLRPPSAHLKRQNSLDEIYGLYGQKVEAVIADVSVMMQEHDTEWPLRSNR